MKYNKSELVLLSEKISDDKLTKEEKIAMNKILSDYNKVFFTAVKEQEFIKRKEKQYAQETEQNNELLERNRFLEQNMERYYKANKEHLNYIKELEAEIRRLKRIFYENNIKIGD